MAGRWAARLHELATEECVPGAALGVWADGQEWLAAHGVLNEATGVNATPDSLFQIGSITKVWTATMIMQLAGEGRLSLDTTVAEVLPGLRLGTPDASAEVTIRHLLTHSSGIDGDIFTDTGRGSGCLERYASRLAGVERIFPPGAAYSYCNSGFVLLGRIIEVLDGRHWDVSLRERLTRPLHLARTVTLPEQAILHRAAVGHREHPQGVPGGRVPGQALASESVSVWALPRSLGPAGGIVATAGDVLTFVRMHLDGGVAADGTRLLAEDLVTAMPRLQLPVPSFGGRGDEVGLGWRRYLWSGGRLVIGHDGSTVGQAAFLRVDPGSRVAVCLLTNSPEAEPLMRRLFAEIFAEHAGVTMPAEPGPAAGLARADLRQHAGRYERTSRRFDVTVRDGRLHVVSSMTGDLAALTGEEPAQVDLHPADSSGERFVGRRYDSQPWTGVAFGRLADGTPYLFTGGRVTPRVG
jgi:CubicO group peptidase (beta-lactamase class C family)